MGAERVKVGVIESKPNEGMSCKRYKKNLRYGLSLRGLIR